MSGKAQDFRAAKEACRDGRIGHLYPPELYGASAIIDRNVVDRHERRAVEKLWETCGQTVCLP